MEEFQIGITLYLDDVEECAGRPLTKEEFHAVFTNLLSKITYSWLAKIAWNEYQNSLQNSSEDPEKPSETKA